LGEMRTLCGPKIVLVGNIPPRDVMATGTPDQVISAVSSAFGETTDHNRVVWSVGGGMPPDVKNENINAFIEAVRKNS